MLDASYHRSQLPGLHALTLHDGGPPRARLHDRLILLAMKQGQALVRYRGAEHRLLAGHTLLVEPGEVHIDLEKSSYQAHMIALRPELLRSLRGAGAPMRIGPSVTQDSALLTALLALHESLREERSAAEQERRAGALLKQLQPLWLSTGERADVPLILRARRMIDERLGESLTLTGLARSLGCSPSYLAHVFSRWVGIGPHGYQVQLRVLAARAHIEAGGTVAEAAARWGFSDQSHLNRHFRRRFAVAPGRYGRALGGGSG